MSGRRLVPCRQPAPRGALILFLIALVLGTASASAYAASDVVISQIYGGGGNSGATYKNDFIELFNRGSAPVSLNGWSVQYASTTGTSWSNKTNLPDIALQPGQYLLIQEAAGSGGTADLPTPDVIGAINLSGTAGKVALVNTATTLTGSCPTGAAVVDFVGFGSGTNCSEAAPAATLSNATAAQRAGQGCTDSDNNSADFASGAPTPRNSASLQHSCGAPVNAAIVPVCPATLSVTLGQAGSASLSASDSDGRVNGASITSASVPGIALGALTPASAVGSSASVALDVANTAAAGTYPVVIDFTNDQAQNASCTVAVSVQAPVAVTKTIPQIQGSGASSPFAGTTQTAEGVVTAVFPGLRGYYLQDPLGDGDPTTSDGIFVFVGSAPTVSVGDRVRITATVSEFNSGSAANPVTELVSPSAVSVLSSGNSVTPTAISIPLSSANDLERYEGMLVSFSSPLTVSQNYFQGRYGQVTLSAGRLEKPTNRYPAGSPAALAATAANAANMILLDDGSSAQNPNPTPYIGAGNTLRAGDSVTALVGVIDYGLATSSNPGPTAYKLHPVSAPVFSRDNARSPAPVVTLGNLRVASFNVLNYFTTFTDGTTAGGQVGQGCTLGGSTSAANCRGADSLAEFNRQQAKIVAAMQAIDADVFGLMEIQNNGETAVANLVAALNAAAGSGTYDYVPMPTGAGSTGTDAIRVAMIYKPARLTLVGASLSDPDTINNRPPLAQTFQATNGERFSVVVNHLKSKSSCPGDGSANDDQGDGQGCWNALRVLQAQRLANVFIPQVQTAANDPDVLAIGDFNSYGFEDPINTLTGQGLVNEIERFVRPVATPYSYVFDGEAGYIDHGLATAALDAQTAGVTEWHINADEPSIIDYNLEFKQPACTTCAPDLYTATPYRASDHDPVVVSLNLQATAVDVTSQLSVSISGLRYNRAAQTYSGTLRLSSASYATSQPLLVQLNGLTAGVTLVNASGQHAGAPYITVTGGISAGGSVSVPLTFRNPGNQPINYTVQVFAGAF